MHQASSLCCLKMYNGGCVRRVVFSRHMHTSATHVSGGAKGGHAAPEEEDARHVGHTVWTQILGHTPEN